MPARTTSGDATRRSDVLVAVSPKRRGRRQSGVRVGDTTVLGERESESHWRVVSTYSPGRPRLGNGRAAGSLDPTRPAPPGTDDVGRAGLTADCGR